jgi:hypothetical protein
VQAVGVGDAVAEVAAAVGLHLGGKGSVRLRRSGEQPDEQVVGGAERPRLRARYSSSDSSGRRPLSKGASPGRPPWRAA